MATVSLAPVIKRQFSDSNGNPLAGGKVYTYQSGTTTPQTTYTDASGVTQNANPIILDASGEASIWLDVSLSYKFVVKDSTDVTLKTEDGIIGLLTNNSVNTAALQDGSVTTVKIADSAVTAIKIADGTITLQKLASSLTDILTPPGIMLPYMGSTAPTSWLLANGSTIGNASSGGTARANADTSALFTVLWNSITNTELPIQDSSGSASVRGASAAADFAANKRMPLPDARNVFIRGANASTRTIGIVGYPVVTLGSTTIDQLQGHGHQAPNASSAGGTTGFWAGSANGGSNVNGNFTSTYPTDGVNGTPRVGNETRPVNLGANFIIKL